MFNHRSIRVAVFIATAVLLLSVAGRTFGATIDELQNKISERESAIKQLEAEIAATQKQIDYNQGQQKTLKGVISIFDAEQKKVLAQIKVTEQKISAKQLEIEVLSHNITDKGNSIQKSSLGLGETIRNLDSSESNSMVEALLNSQNLSELWDVVAESMVVGTALKSHMVELRDLKLDLENNKKDAEAIRADLVSLSKELTARKKIAENASAEKKKILSQTKNQESEYQRLLKKQLADKNTFERELLDFESQLKMTIDPRYLPSVGTGVLYWPLGLIKITQYFGNTDFATKNPQVYNGMGHNGVDFKASIGTPIKASLGGIIKGIGDTDIACPGTSYGRWILIEHDNGLSTIYAHLSTFAVSTGDQVNLGQVIGWSGNTGYTTGPHLHFGVYATQGVQIISRQSKICRGTYTMPVASLKAYLNPLSYL